MSSSDRVAFVTLLRDASSPRAAQGSLDAEAVAERLGQRDAEFEIVHLDASDDIAGQIDDRLAERASPPSEVVFYVSCDTIPAEGELLLQLDPSQPDTVDALADIVEALTEPQLRGEDASTLMLLELRAASEDPLELAELADQARRAAKASPRPVELIVSVRPVEEAEGTSVISPLTRAMLRHLDEADPAEGLYASELVDTAFDTARGFGRAGALAHASVKTSFTLLVAEEVTARIPQVAPIAEPSTPALDEEEAADTRALDWEDGDGVPPTTLPSATPSDAGPAPGAPPPHEPEDAEQAGPVSRPGPGSSDSLPPESLTTPSLSRPPPPPRGSIPPFESIPPARPSTPPPTSRDILSEADSLLAAGNDEEAIAKLRKALGLVGATASGEDADQERARIHLRIGDAMLRAGRGKEAIASFEKGFSLGPGVAGTDRALRMLLTLYLGEGDRRGVSSVEERIVARLDPGSGELVQELVTFGRAWMIELDDPLRARERLEHARAIAPQNREVVRLLVQLAERDGRDDEVLTLRKTLAELDPDPRTRATGLADLGRELLKRGREDDGLDLLDAALEADPATLEPLEVLSRVLGERQEWGELEAAYRRMLERARALSSESPELGELVHGVEHELHKRLGLLLLQHLEDPEAALEAFEAASEAKPGEPGVRRAAAELAHRLGRADTAERHLAALVGAAQRDVEAYRLLFDVFVRTEQIERAVDVGAVLSRLGVATDRERVVVSSHEDDELAKPRSVLDAQDWAILRAPLGAAEDPEAAELVAGVFHAAGEALIKAFASLASRAGRLAPLDESLRVGDPEASTVSAVRSLLWASQVLGVDTPAIYLEEASAEGMRHVLRDTPVTVVGASALRGRTLEELRFLAGYHLAGDVLEHRIVRLAPNIDDLAACFLAAVVIAVPDTPVPERIRSLVEMIVPSLSAFLSPEAEEALEEAVMAFDAAGGRADLVAFQRAVERSGLRAGWLLSRKLPSALDAAATLGAGPLSLAEREGEIFAFSVSDPSVDLRAKLY